MVTSKRKVVREEDKARYYEDVPVSKAKEETEVRFNDDLMMTRSYIEVSSAPPTPAEPAYKPAAKTAVADEVAVPVRRPMRIAEVMPIVVKKRAETETEKETVISSKNKTLSPTMKKALIAYLSIVIILTIAVITTGVLINNYTADVNRSEDTLMSLSSTIALQESRLAMLSDPVELAKLAEDLNMVNANSGIASPLVSIVETNEAKPTNWFNDFCDWIGRIFGG